MDDLISRQAAIDALHMHLMYRMGTDSNKKRLDDWINGVPAAQPERMRWNFIGYNQFQCPKCGAIYTATQMEAIKIYDDGPELSNYCPNCGAKMEETE